MFVPSRVCLQALLAVALRRVATGTLCHAFAVWNRKSHTLRSQQHAAAMLSRTVARAQARHARGAMQRWQRQATAALMADAQAEALGTTLACQRGMMVSQRMYAHRLIATLRGVT